MRLACGSPLRKEAKAPDLTRKKGKKTEPERAPSLSFTPKEVYAEVILDVPEGGRFLSHPLAPDETWSQEKGVVIIDIMYFSPDARKELKRAEHQSFRGIGSG